MRISEKRTHLIHTFWESNVDTYGDAIFVFWHIYQQVLPKMKALMVWIALTSSTSLLYTQIMNTHL